MTSALEEQLFGTPDPQEVTVVRPEKTRAELIGLLVGMLVGFFVRAGLVSWGSTMVEMVPDWSYVESMFVVLLANWLFLRSPKYNFWSKGWADRRAAVLEQLKKGKK